MPGFVEGVREENGMIIDKPGFYTSKAGKCEVVAVRETDGGTMAVGYCNHGDAAIWLAENGHMQFVAHDLCSCHITGPWTEPRKPVEAWCIVAGVNIGTYGVYLDKGVALMNAHGLIGASLKHLREVEDEAP